MNNNEDRPVSRHYSPPGHTLDHLLPLINQLKTADTIYFLTPVDQLKTADTIDLLTPIDQLKQQIL